MKIKSILLLIIFFVLAQNVFAQEKKIDIECNLVINETNWTKGSQIKATITVKNNSDEEVKINLPPYFRLLKQGKKVDDTENTIDDEYDSNEREEDHIIIKKKGNSKTYFIRQYFNLSLKIGESKTVEFDVSKLGWHKSISSIWVYRDWYNFIPSGNYDLYYYWGYNFGEKEKLRRISIVSNSISVKLSSEK